LKALLRESDVPRRPVDKSVSFAFGRGRDVVVKGAVSAWAPHFVLTLPGVDEDGIIMADVKAV